MMVYHNNGEQAVHRYDKAVDHGSVLGPHNDKIDDCDLMIVTFVAAYESSEGR